MARGARLIKICSSLLTNRAAKYQLTHCRCLGSCMVVILPTVAELVPDRGLTQIDVIGEAVAAGLAACRDGTARSERKSRRAVLKATELVRRANEPDAVLRFIRQYPDCEPMQLIAARLLDRQDDASSLARWQGIAARFPHSHEAFCGLVAAILRHAGPPAARRMIERRYARHGIASHHLGLVDDDDESFARLMDFFSQEGIEAFDDLLLGIRTRPSFATELRERLLNFRGVSARRIRLPFTNLRARSRQAKRDVSPTAVAALREMLDGALAEREAMLSKGVPSPGSAVMVTGSLGPGGSERQFVRTAVGMKDAGFLPYDRIRLFTRSPTVRPNALFFLPELRRAGIPVHHISDLPQFGGDPGTSSLRGVADKVVLLPRPMREASIRLTDELRRIKPDIVHLWQDGIVYDSGLAALLAKVPRIILSTRSVPPVDRPDRNRPEFVSVFRALLSGRNVSLSVNSEFAATRYAEWLDIDPTTIVVIRNGVAAPSSAGDSQSEERFRRFQAATGPSAVTLGTVMRMDHNKRPLLWIETAAKILRAQPTARFILVGEGLLRHHAISRVAALGIADRFLFVGLSSQIGFWLSKMDLFLLTSKFEGLPNALVEAQLSRVPVITTPAGGAPEALIPGITGLVTSSDASADELAARVLTLAVDPDRRRRMGEVGAKWAADAFSVPRMLQQTAELFRSPVQARRRTG